MSDTKNMEDTEVTTVTLPDDSGKLYPMLTRLPETSTERCDRCGESTYAMFLVIFLSKQDTELELALCGHHTRTLGFGDHVFGDRENRTQGSDH